MNQSMTLFFYLCTCCLFTVVSLGVDAKIVFTMDDNIYVMNDDGSSRRRLTNNPDWKDIDASWSPDGKKSPLYENWIRREQALMSYLL